MSKKCYPLSVPRTVPVYHHVLEASWNVMAQAQKPDFVFRRNGRIPLNRQGVSVQSTTGSRGVRISGSDAGYNMFRGSVKGTGYPLYSPVSPSLPLPCVTVCHHISTGVYRNLLMSVEERTEKRTHRPALVVYKVLGSLKTIFMELVFFEINLYAIQTFTCVDTIETVYFS